MKIVSITMVKNEVDIIESFIRYHLNIVDEMIILDNYSNDKTLEIIEKLISEGLSVVLIKDTDNSYIQSIKMNYLLKKAIEEYSADIVCALDVDEFIVTSDNSHPREVLETIDNSYYYLAKWITYVPTENDIFDKFIPKRITHIRDESLEAYYKVIVPKEIFNKYTIELTMGNHDLSFGNTNDIPISKNDLNLRIAHFPIRSKEQCMSKVLVGWPNIISINTENKPWGWHWENIFNKIKENNEITDKDVENFAKNYALKDATDLSLEYKPINLDFFKNIEIKYTFEYNYLNNILNNSIELANEIKNLKNKLKKFNQN